MPLSMTCPPCGQTLTADDDAALIAAVQAHVREQHQLHVPSDEILEHAVLT